MERYERLRSSLETEAPFRDTTKSDKLFTGSDISSTKDDYLVTQSDEAISEIDKDPAESDTLRTKGDIESTETDIKRTDSDALRHLLRDSPKTHSKEESHKQQLQEHTHSLKSSNHQRSSVNVAVAVSSSWDISKILTEAAIRKSDRRPIETRWDELQQAFVAWLLWSFATKTIESPVLHTVSRIKDRDPPPEGFLDLAGVPSDELWEWLLGDLDEVPDQYYETVQLLREQGADQGLLRIGFNPPDFSRDEDAEYLAEDDADAAVPDAEEIDDGCGTLIGGRTARDTWVAALGQLQMEIPKASFDTWLRDAEIIGYSEGIFEVGVQNTYARDWLEDRLKSTAGRVLTGVVGEKMEVRFVVM